MQRNVHTKIPGTCGIPVILLLVVTARVAASSTGLNNIVTADTPSDRTIVFQAFTHLANDRDAEYWAGFKMGLDPFGQKFEWGVDHRFGDDAGRAVLQFKYALPLGEDLPTIATGVTNLGLRSQDRDVVGQPFKFGVLTHDFGPLRAHVGYGFQPDNDAAFFGFDKTVTLFERDLMLRSDFTQIDDQEQWMGSAGFIYFIDDHLAVESWVSQPFDDGDPRFTLKLNWAFTF